MITITYNGRTFSGTPEDVAAKLKNSNMFTTGETLTDYMKGVSRRFDEFTETSVRHDTAEHFITDMVASGILKQIN